MRPAVVMAPPGAQPALRPGQGLVLLWAAAAVGAMAAGLPPIVTAAGALAALATAALLRPDLATPVLVLLLYTNAVGLAVTRYGLPEQVGLVFPAVLLLPLAHHLVVRRRPLVFGPAAGWMLVLLAVQILGVMRAREPAWAAEAAVEYLTEGVIFYLLVVNAVRTAQALRWAVWALLLAGAILGGLALHQQATGRFDSDYAGFAQVSAATFETGDETLAGTPEQPRLAGAIGQQNYHAQLMLMLVPIGVLATGTARSARAGLVAGGLTGLTLAGAALTFSRGAAVALVLVVLVAWTLGLFRRRHLLLMLVGAFAVLQLFPQYAQRLGSVTEVAALLTGADGGVGLEAADGSTQSRTTEMAAAAAVFADHPILGVGPSSFRFYYEEYTEGVGLRSKETERVAHNLYLEMAANSGLLGLGAFLAAAGVTLVNLSRARRRLAEVDPALAGMAAAFFLAIVAYLASGLFLSLAFARYFWLVMALAWAVCTIGRERAEAALPAACPSDGQG